jgi:hypothetical protein
VRRLLLIAPLLLCGADCVEDDGPQAPARSVHAELLDPGPNVSDRRSQDSGIVDWPGGDDLLFVPMRRPVSVAARVFQAESTTPLSDICIFLDTAGTLSDLARSSDSTGNWGYGVVPGIYDALLAPECMVGSTATLPIEELTINSSSTASPLQWELPPTDVVEGVVLGSDGAGVGGATVTVYRVDEPDLPIGVATTSLISLEPDQAGTFSIEVPDGFYDIVVSTPWNGSVAIPPARSENRPLPPSSPITVGVNLPPAPTVAVRGSLEDGSGNLLQGRLRVVGDIAPIGFPVDYPGGTFRAEFDTTGEWELTLPSGTYTASSFPAHGGLQLEQTLGLASADFLVDANVGPPADVAVVYGEPRLGRVVVRDPDGEPYAGRVNLRMTSAPHYAYQLEAGEEGIVVASLIPDLYEVEVLPERDAQGNKLYARGHGELDLTEANAETEIWLPVSDIYEGVVVTSDQGQIGRMKVVLRDPGTGKVVDDALSDDSEQFRGFFRGVLPR